MTTEKEQPSAVHLLFDGPPGPECGRFVEAEDPTGKSVNAGEWSQRPDGYWQLVIQQPSAGVADERAAFEDAMGASILAEQGKFSLSRSYDAGNPYTLLATRWAYEGWQARARLNTTHTSAGVVLPERMEVPGPLWKDARQPYGNPLNAANIRGAELFNLAIDEIARLNPCRAQAVPEGYVLVPVEPTLEMMKASKRELEKSPVIWCRYKAAYRAMLAAAPSAKMEGE